MVCCKALNHNRRTPVHLGEFRWSWTQPQTFIPACSRRNCTGKVLRQENNLFNKAVEFGYDLTITLSCHLHLKMERIRHHLQTFLACSFLQTGCVIFTNGDRHMIPLCPIGSLAHNFCQRKAILSMLRFHNNIGFFAREKCDCITNEL
ncbi:hypothetical protein D3C76_1198540 [compost metagenome]